MCRFFAIPRSLYYYRPKTKPADDGLRQTIKEIFHRGRQAYGARKIQKVLLACGIQISRRKVRQIMAEEGLVSVYQVKKYQVHKTKSNQANIENIVNQQFDDRKKLEVVVSDLTYVQVGNRWCYICPFLDLHNREVIGWSVGPRKTADLVYEAILSIRYPLDQIALCHTDRGSEFDNQLIDQALHAFGIERSLSRPGNPYDNAVIESFNNIMKKEFIWRYRFDALQELKTELFDYLHWYNNERIHSSLGYVAPTQFRKVFT